MSSLPFVVCVSSTAWHRFIQSRHSEATKWAQNEPAAGFYSNERRWATLGGSKNLLNRPKWEKSNGTFNFRCVQKNIGSNPNLLTIYLGKKLSIGRRKPINTIPNEFLFLSLVAKMPSLFLFHLRGKSQRWAHRNKCFIHFSFVPLFGSRTTYNDSCTSRQECCNTTKQTKGTTFRRIKNNKIISNTNWIYIWLHTNGTKILVAFRPQIHNGNRWICR